MEEMAEERKYSKLEWFFYIIFIPLLFTLVLSAVIAQMFGYNVMGILAKELNKVPVLEKVIPDAAVDSSAPAEDGNKADEKDSKISELEIKLEAKEREIADLKRKAELEKQKMDQVLQQAQKHQEATKAAEKKATEEEQKKAAPILEKMAPEEAAQLLLTMKAEERSAIMAKMDPKKAADLSLLLKEASPEDLAEPSAIQQQLLELKYNASVRELASSISSMQPASAADLVEKLFKTDEKRAVLVLSQMNAEQRGQILSKLAENPNGAAVAAKISQKLLTY